MRLGNSFFRAVSSLRLQACGSAELPMTSTPSSGLSFFICSMHGIGVICSRHCQSEHSSAAAMVRAGDLSAELNVHD